MRPHRHLSSLVVATLGLLAAAPAAAQQGQTGAIAGTVVERESGQPLPFGVVAIPALGVERFVGERGAFALRGLAPGSYVLRVRRLGFAPRQLDVTVRAGATDTVHVTLDRLATRLAAIRVSAPAECVTPSAHTAAADAGLVDAMTQLRMNAEQYRLLARSYPFRYLMRERRVETQRSGETRAVHTDTVLVASDANWRYRPGQLLTWESGTEGKGTLRFNIPTLADLADSSFVANHCFNAAGMERVAELGDGELLRIDFLAAKRIADPDVHGTIYLDPASFQIRRTVLRLSRMPSFGGLRAMEVTSDFDELFPSVPIIGRIDAEMRYDGPGRRGLVSVVSRQQTIGHSFVRERPDDVRIP